MNVNKYKFLLDETNPKKIDIPIEINWDFLDRGQGLDTFEEQTIEEILNFDKDFETARFSHSPSLIIQGAAVTQINYEFYFVPTGFTSSNISNAVWQNTYINQGFTPKEIYYFSNSFKGSFFKLDFYDSPDNSNQTNYFTVIIPTQQGEKETVIVGQQNLNIKKPKFILDYIGDKEGFFFYWLRNRDFLNISTFYMSAKFFDAKVGEFVKMTNKEQKNILPSPFNFKPESFFYYRVVLDYDDFTYKIYNSSNQRVGDSINPIKWYEYINP
jgi:hypothetical protein